jgi:ribosome-binding factor A
MSNRNPQTESTIQRTLGKIIADGLNDPRIRGVISVTQVVLSSDGRSARVGISVMPDEQQELTMHGLRAASGHLRRAVSQRVRARFIPTLEFFADKGLKKESRLIAEINQAVREDEEREPSDPAESFDGEPTENPDS